MSEFLASPLANVVILVAVTAALVVVGVYVIGRVRAGMHGHEPPTSALLTKFKELHAQGELTSEEYRTIKGMLAERLQRELKVTDEPR